MISRPAEQVILHAILETLSHAKVPAHTAGLAAWAKTKLTAEGVVAVLETAGPFEATLPRKDRAERLQTPGRVVLPLHFFEIFGKMLVHHLGVVESAAVFEHLFFDHELRFQDESDFLLAARRDEVWKEIVTPLVCPGTGAVLASPEVKARLKARAANAPDRSADPQWMSCRKWIADVCNK